MKIQVLLRRLCLLSSTLGLVCAHGAERFVSTLGNDSNPGTALQPVRTITRAYSLAGAGDTITVLPGVYTDYTSGWGLRLGKNGTAASPITLRSQIIGAAVIDGQNLPDRNQGIWLDGSYNVIEGFEIRGGPHGGIAVYGNNNYILSNDIHHNGTPASSSSIGQDGIFSDPNTRNNVYAGNFIRDNGRTGSNLDHALYLCGDNELVINNVLVRNAAYGLHLAGYSTVSNLRAYNNVMAYNGKGGVMLWMALSGVDIRNNIIYRNGQFGINSWDAHGSGVVVDRNLVFGNSLGNYSFSNGGSDYTYTLGTTLSSEPLFVNSTSAGLDAHLRLGSPAINAGVNFSSIFTTDLDGVVRPASGAWDIGPYQFVSLLNTAPTISGIPGQTIPQGGSTGSLNFTVGDVETPAGNLTVTGTSSNPTLVPASGIVFGGSGANRTVTVTPAATQTGTASITVSVSDGSLTTSTSFILAVNPPAPTIALTAPANGASYTAPATINLAASVTPNGNTISKVQFYAGTTLLGEDTTAPYTFTWNNVNAGNHTLSARAVYGSGGSVASSPVGVSVAFGLTFESTAGIISAPFVAGSGVIYQTTFTATPASGGRAIYTFNVAQAGDYIVTALVNAPDDSANSFFVNLDAEPTDPVMIWDIPVTSGLAERAVSWRGSGTPTSNEFAPKVFTLTAGSHQLIVRGREANAQLGTITLKPYPASNPPPTITLTAPANGASYAAPATIDLAASVNANGNTISKVQFYQGATLLGEDTSAPYTFTWSNVNVGAYSLSARAVYGSNTATSSPVNVSVVSGLTFESTSGSISAPFLAANGVIYQTNHSLSVAEAGRAVYTFQIASAGDYVVTALVNAPDAGANSFFVNLDAEPADPTMIWDIPVTSGLAERTASWRGNGTPDSNEFAPKVFTLTAGTHQLIVRGREANTQLGTITIKPHTSTDTPPVVTLTAPVNSSTVSGSVTVTADASDNGGVAGVQFKLDGANLGGEVTAAPYSVTWDTTAVADGTHTLTAVARDTAGNQTTAAAVNVMVSNTVPTVLPTVAVVATDATATIGTTDHAAITFTRTGDTSAALTVNYTLGGTAVKWIDYRRPEGDMPVSVTIPAGTASYTMTIIGVTNATAADPHTAVFALAAERWRR
jgi:sulfur relay (sulfurtransferase) complex TusBCD TusD component (DsrE family)